MRVCIIDLGNFTTVGDDVRPTAFMITICCFFGTDPSRQIAFVVRMLVKPVSSIYYNRFATI